MSSLLCETAHRAFDVHRDTGPGGHWPIPLQTCAAHLSRRKKSLREVSSVCDPFLLHALQEEAVYPVRSDLITVGTTTPTNPLISPPTGCWIPRESLRGKWEVTPWDTFQTGDRVIDRTPFGFTNGNTFNDPQSKGKDVQIRQKPKKKDPRFAATAK